MILLDDPWRDGLRSRWGDIWRAWRVVLENGGHHDSEPAAKHLARVLGVARVVFARSGGDATKCVRDTGFLMAYRGGALWTTEADTSSILVWELERGAPLWPCSPLGVIGCRVERQGNLIADRIAASRLGPAATATASIAAALPGVLGRIARHRAASSALRVAFPSRVHAAEDCGAMRADTHEAEAIVAACVERGVEAEAFSPIGVVRVPCRAGLGSSEVERIIEAVRAGLAKVSTCA